MDFLSSDIPDLRIKVAIVCLFTSVISVSRSVCDSLVTKQRFCVLC